MLSAFWQKIKLTMNVLITQIISELMCCYFCQGGNNICFFTISILLLFNLHFFSQNVMTRSKWNVEMSQLSAIS